MCPHLQIWTESLSRFSCNTADLRYWRENLGTLSVSVSDPDPGSVGSVIFSRIRIRLENNGS